MSTPAKQINNLADLDLAILELQAKAERQKKEVLLSFEGVKESLRPMNLLKQTVHSTFNPDKKTDLLGTALGLGSGILGRRILFGRSGGILGKLLGTAVEFGLGGVVTKNADRIKEKGSELIDRFLRQPRGKKRPVAIRPERPGLLKKDPGSAVPNGFAAGNQLVPDPESEHANFLPKN